MSGALDPRRGRIRPDVHRQGNRRPPCHWGSAAFRYGGTRGDDRGRDTLVIDLRRRPHRASVVPDRVRAVVRAHRRDGPVGCDGAGRAGRATLVWISAGSGA